MTAKRFVKTHKTINWWAVLDNGKELLEDEVVELLNALNEENEQLRKEKIDAEVKLYSATEKILMQMDYDEIIKQNSENEIEITNLKKDNEQLKEQLSEAKADEEQLGISFMGYKMKLIEVLQKKYDKVKGKTLYADVYTEIAEEMGVDLE